MRWLRLYDDTINDPKVLKLPEATRWHWIALLCVASKNDGILPHLDDIAIQLRITAAKATEIIAALVKAGLLDRIETGFTPHNWNGRQYKSDVSTGRVKRFRNGQRNATRNVLETTPETEADTETDKPEANASGADAPLDPSIAEREYFARGREVLGKSAGGMLAKLLKAKGGNVALARSALEAASQKQNPAEYVAGCCRDGPLAKPLTEFQRKQSETNDVRAELRNLANGGRSGGSTDRLLPLDHGERSEDLRSGPRTAFLALSGASGGKGH